VKKWWILVCVLCAAWVHEARGECFVALIYAGDTLQKDDLEAFLEEAPTYGLAFGYDTEVFGSGWFFDLEAGYEVSTHRLEGGAPDDHYYRNHRCTVGLRVKYGGLGFLEPYVGWGKLVYAVYDASDALSASNLELEKNFGGEYFSGGMDFYLTGEGTFCLGLEYRTTTCRLVAADDPSRRYDARVDRIAFILTLFF